MNLNILKFVSVEELINYEIKNSVVPSILEEFKNEAEPLVEFLINRALPESLAEMSKTHLLVKNDLSKIMGFFTLSTVSLERADLSLTKKPPYRYVPGILIGRLGREESAKGQGIGDLLMEEIFRLVINASNDFGIKVIITDAKSDLAKIFYSDFGFKVIKSHVNGNYPIRMYLEVEAIKKAKQI